MSLAGLADFNPKKFNKKKAIESLKKAHRSYLYVLIFGFFGLSFVWITFLKIIFKNP